MALVTALLALPANGVSPAGTLTNTTGQFRLSVALTAPGIPGTWELIKQNVDSGDWFYTGVQLNVGDDGVFVGELEKDDAESNALYHVVQTRPDGTAVLSTASVYLSAETVISQSVGAVSTTTLNATGAVTLDSTVAVGSHLTVAGNTTLGDAATDTITLTGVVAGNVTMLKENAHTIAIGASTTATAAGGAITVAAGAGATTGAGGAYSAVGGAGGATGAGGAASVTGGAGGATSGVGGAASLVGGVGTAGNSAGGAMSATGGAGQGSAAGGAAAVAGGVGGATGAGGASSIKGGAGGATSGTGGAVSVVGGAGSAGNANGGAVTIDGGAKNGAGTDGAIDIGTSAGAITLGKSTTILTFQSKQAAGAATNTIADPGTGVAIPVTADGVVPIVTAAAETNTLAIPSYMGQELILAMDTRVGGDRVVTASQPINQAGNTIMTFGAARDTICLRGITVGGALRWQVAWNEGVALS